MNRELEDQLLNLIEKQLEDNLSDAEITELDQLVTSNEEAGKFYTYMMQQHALLNMGAVHMESKLEVRETDEKVTFFNPKLAYSLAALLLIGVMTGWFVMQRQNSMPEPIAKISHTRFTKWGDSTIPTAEGAELLPGRLNLLQGLVTLSFNSGAKMELEGPVEIELIDAMNARLHTGIVVTEIPDSAKGFTILTPTSKAVDHGTKFLTQVSPRGESTIVNVLEGEVEVVHQDRGSHHIFDGEMIKTTKNNLEQKNYSSEIGFGYQSESQEQVYSLSTADGQGGDGTAFKMNKDYHYNAEMIMIKNSDNDFNRKGYLKFDLSLLPNEPFNQVELQLHTVHSQYGSVALSDELATFSVYAILADELDQWSGGLLNWEDAPANAPGSAEVNTSSTLKLGEYSIPKGKVNGKVNFSSPKLLDVVKNDSNKILTLIIVQETLGDQIGQNYVYAISSNKHPDLPSPTLIFRQAQN